MLKTYNDNTKLKDIPKDLRLYYNSVAIRDDYMKLDLTLRVNEMSFSSYESRCIARSRVNETLLVVDNETGEVIKDNRLDYDDIKIEFPSWLGLSFHNREDLERFRNEIHKDNPQKELLLHIGAALNKAKYEKKKRLKEYICGLLSKPCIFLTIDLNDTYLNNTKLSTRRQHITRYLDSLGVPYVANIDFGKKGEREHYHALIQCESVPVGFESLWVKKNRGCIYAKKVYDPNAKRIAEYILKFTNHATKTTTRSCNCIYSRKNKLTIEN